MDTDDLRKFRKESEKALGKARSKKAANERYRQLRGQRGSELELWRQWKEGGKQPHHLNELLQSLEPMIDSEARKRASGTAGSVPHATVKAHLRQAVIAGLTDYDPNRGAALSTHLHNKFKAVGNIVAAQRNVKYMPKAYTDQYQEFQNARSQFEMNQGRPPTIEEIRPLLPNMSKKLITQMDRGFGGEAFTDFGSGDLKHDPGSLFNKQRSAVQFMRATLSEDERKFADLYFAPTNVKPATPEQISRRTGIPLHRVYKLKASVEQKIEPAIRRQ